MRRAFGKPALTLLVLTSIVLAGCTGGGAKETPSASSIAASPTVDAFSGSIAGEVVDDELLPVEGVAIAVRQTAFVTTTDSSGVFTINGVPPGEYALDIARLGYQAQAKTVTVAAGEISEVKVTLVALAVDEPRFESIPFSGQFQCSVAAIDVLWQDCGVESKSYFYFEKPTGVRHVLGELKWTSASAGTGQNLDFNLVKGTSVSDTESSQWYANTFGPSPLRLHVTVGVQFENPNSPAAVGASDQDRVVDDEDTKLGYNIYSSPTYVADQALVGVTLDQSFDGYVTLFYDMDVPEGFSAFPDA